MPGAPSTTPTRTALLDAAYDAMVAGDWGGTRMADVATAAGVSRQTLYNEFGSKDALAVAIVQRETERFLAGTDAAMAAHDGDAFGAVHAAVLFTLAEAADNPLLKAVLTGAAEELLPFLTTRAEPVFTAARERIAAEIVRRWPRLAAADVELATDTVVRLTISHLVSPEAAPDVTADRITTVVRRLLALPDGRTSA